MPQSNHMITEGKDSGRVPMQQPMQVPMQQPMQVSMQQPMQVPMQVPMQQPMQVPMQQPMQVPHSGSMFGVCSARLEGIVRQAEAQLAIK